MLRSLIDEALQLQEVARFDVTVEQAEVDAAVAEIARRNNLSPEQLRQLFERNGIPLSTLERQLEAGIGWQRLIQRRFGRNVDVSEQDIDDVIARFLANRDRPEYLVAEIFLPVDDPAGEAEIRQLADSLVRQIRGGAPFAAVAREFSRSAGAASGGDLGWVIEGQLDPALDQAMAAMAPGQLSDPVRSLAGYHILLLRDRRRPGSSDPADQVVSLARLLLPFRQGSPEADRMMAAARAASAELKDCDALRVRAADLGVADTADAGTGALSRLPPAVQELIADLPVGQPTAPQRFDGGVIVFMVCDRQLPARRCPPRPDPRGPRRGARQPPAAAAPARPAQRRLHRRPGVMAQAGPPSAATQPLREVIARHGLSARRSLGQNFLLDLNLTGRIARAAGPLAGVTAIEVGPGPGGLTRALLATDARAVVAIERDPRCIAALAELAAAFPGRLTVIQGDALATDWERVAPAPRAIVANLPYNIATPLLIGWLKRIELFEGITAMFQKEVAQRLVAAPGSPAYGRLSVMTRWRAAPQLLFTLPSRAFTPQPKVESAVVRLAPRPGRQEVPWAMMELATATAFGQRRKMLRASLRRLGEPEALLAAAGIDPTLRAEDVDLAGFVRLARALESRRVG